MNSNKLASVLNRIFHIVFLLCFVSAFLCIIIRHIFFSSLPEAYAVSLLFLSFILLAAASVFLYGRLIQSPRRLKNTSAPDDRQTKCIIISSALILLALQLLAGYKLRMNPVTDLEIISRYCLDFAKTGSFDLIRNDYTAGKVYLVRYPNNVALTLLLSALYRLCYCVFGSVPGYAPVVLNCLALNTGIVFTSLTAQKLFGNKKALFALALCALFAPYYTYTAYYYTDSFSMPFMAGGIFFFLCALKSDSRIKACAFAAASGIIVFTGFKIKATVVFVLICAVIYVILKKRLREAVCLLAALLISFSASAALYDAGVGSLNIATKEQSFKSQYPYTHWIMMGLKGKGAYNRADSRYTSRFPDKRTKAEANIKEIRKRVRTYGIKNLGVHIAKKVSWTWMDGTYFISHHIENPVKKNLLHSFVLNSGENHLVFYIYSNAFQLMLMFLIIMSIIKGIINPAPEFTTLLKGLAFMIFLFLIVWETRSRYLFNFTPVFILLSVDGLDFITSLIKNLHRKPKTLPAAL